jgi:hypothetical protein
MTVGAGRASRDRLPHFALFAAFAIRFAITFQ